MKRRYPENRREHAKKSALSDQPAMRSTRHTFASLPFALLLLICAQIISLGQAHRIVIIKVDGLPNATVERFVHEHDSRTGKSLLPWIDQVFYENGTRVANFYVRGMSLSSPSWSLLDTGQHLQIKGNVEFDRFTLHSYDYLNFIPFWVANVAHRHVDMPGPEVLDEVGVPLLVDTYPYDERYHSFQLYQRGLRWTTLERGLKNRITSRSPGELFDEWTLGFETRSIVMEQLERELIEKLNDPRIRYLDFYTSEFDHSAHHNHDRGTQLAALQDLDATVGRFWTAIQKSPQAADTALVLVSDHGFNSDERVYSQGFNLVKLLGSIEGGGHHVITKRRLLNDYALKAIYPFVPLITTTTQNSYYLKGQSSDYPTALLDFDGNERASIHLRNSDLNLLHILLIELQRRDLAPAVRRAATVQFFSTLEQHRPDWQQTLDDLREELGALRRLIDKQRVIVDAQPKKWTKADTDAGRDQAALRESVKLNSLIDDERTYTEYTRTLANLLALKPENFDVTRLRIPDIIARNAMGEQNTIGQLQNYIVGLTPSGLTLKPDGSLDLKQSFKRVDYFSLMQGQTVRNNVQPDVASRPIDFTAARIPAEALDANDGELRADDIIWLACGDDRQALILARREQNGQTLLRYMPIAHLQQSADGHISFKKISWHSDLPLKIWEDRELELPAGVNRAQWLGSWHTDLVWLRALHRSSYSNALIGLDEQFGHFFSPALEADVAGLSTDEQLLRRFRRRKRLLVETDMLLLANNHWNFDVRGFNPGGNHGSFFRVSTHSTLMFAGGVNTKIPHGFTIEEPYDSLSFVPTIMALTGQQPVSGRVTPVNFDSNRQRFPGRVIEELFLTPKGLEPITIGTENGTTWSAH